MYELLPLAAVLGYVAVIFMLVRVLRKGLMYTEKAETLGWVLIGLSVAVLAFHRRLDMLALSVTPPELIALHRTVEIASLVGLPLGIFVIWKSRRKLP
jgi:hypothetical protein